MKKSRSICLWSWLLLFTFIGQMVAAEVVPAGEVVPVTATSKAPANVPTVSPFVGEIAVGVSLLITYGPQILALAATVASIAAAVSVIVNTSKQSAGLVKSVGSKMSNMLQLLLGPLGISTGTTKDGVDGLSKELLSVTKYVTNSISTPVSQIQGQVDKSLAMSRDVQSLAERGCKVAGQVEQYARTTSSELNGIVAGGEVQLFRDGANKVAQRLETEAAQAKSAFRLTLDHAGMTTAGLENVQKTIGSALDASGQKADEVTLHDINLSGTKLSKELIQARKYMVMSNNALTASARSSKGIHTEIMALLNDVKIELEAFAVAHGISKEQLDRISGEQRVKMSGPSAESTLPLDGTEGQKMAAKSISEEINFMVDKLGRINADASRSSVGSGAGSAQAAAALDADSAARAKRAAETDTAYQKMIDSYKAYLNVMTANPADKTGIESAKGTYTAAQEAYQKTLQPAQ